MAARKRRVRAVRSEPVERVSADEIARIWGVSARRVRKFCQEGRVFAARKVDGVWTIPVTAERPVDGRYYRCRNVPSHLEEVVHHADMAMRAACRRRPPYSPQNRINFFMQGSAFHLHKLEPSSLTFDDVRKVIAGKAVGGKSLEDQLAVLWHVKALRHVFEAVRRRRRLSVRLVEELRAILGCGSADGRVRYRQGLDGQCRDGAGRVAELTARLTGGVMHPIVQAGIFIIDFLLASPFDGENERTATATATSTHGSTTQMSTDPTNSAAARSTPSRSSSSRTALNGSSSRRCRHASRRRSVRTTTAWPRTWSSRASTLPCSKPPTGSA